MNENELRWFFEQSDRIILLLEEIRDRLPKETQDEQNDQTLPAEVEPQV